MCYKRYRKKPEIITPDIKVKGIAYDTKQKRWRVRLKGIKQKNFPDKKTGSKEKGFQLAFEYLTGVLPNENEF